MADPAEKVLTGPAALPIRRYAADIVASIKENNTVVVIGETGSGKTTQISQILLDAGFADKSQIAVTQPRRVVRHQLPT